MTTDPITILHSDIVELRADVKQLLAHQSKQRGIIIATTTIFTTLVNLLTYIVGKLI